MFTHRCQRCDRPLTSDHHRCPDCSRWPSPLVQARALYLYEGPLRTALHRVKYRGERRRGEFLGELLASSADVLVGNQCAAVHCVVPIPLHHTRLRERGFNQSSLLAAAVARKLALPLEEGLVRLRATATQVSQDRAARWENVAGAFAWVGQPLEGTVLLVDDVITTGATVIAASEALVTAGARAVIVLALARAAAV